MRWHCILGAGTLQRGEGRSSKGGSLRGAPKLGQGWVGIRHASGHQALEELLQGESRNKARKRSLSGDLFFE